MVLHILQNRGSLLHRTVFMTLLVRNLHYTLLSALFPSVGICHPA